MVVGVDSMGKEQDGTRIRPCLPRGHISQACADAQSLDSRDVRRITDLNGHTIAVSQGPCGSSDDGSLKPFYIYLQKIHVADTEILKRIIESPNAHRVR